jgi:hypothetical protein
MTIADAANTGMRMITVVMMMTTINSKIATVTTAEIAITTVMIMTTTIGYRTSDDPHVKTSVSVSDHLINVMTVVLTVARTGDNVIMRTMTMTNLTAVATMMIIVTVTRLWVQSAQTTDSPQHAVTSRHSVGAISVIAESMMMTMKVITAIMDMIDLALQGGAVMMLTLIYTTRVDVVLVLKQVRLYMHIHFAY